MEASPPPLSPPLSPPACPLTGAAGSVLLEEISPKLLSDLWRLGARVDPAPLHAGAPRIGLWRSPVGLYFFHPAPEGTDAFYRAFYRRFGTYAAFARLARQRPDFAAGAALVQPGDRVLDVGSGSGAFARLVPQARYTGLDPNAPAEPGITVLAESLAAHAARCPEAYDMVCGFQVLEHVANPLAMAADMLRCLRPGGLLVLAMPQFGSPLHRIPNNLLNLPPHHLTWWSESAGLALCAALGLEVVRVAPTALGAPNALWGCIARLCPPRFRPGRFVQPGLLVHLAVAFAFLLGRRLGSWLAPRPGETPVDLLVVARKPERNTTVG